MKKLLLYSFNKLNSSVISEAEISVELNCDSVFFAIVKYGLIIIQVVLILFSLYKIYTKIKDKKLDYLSLYIIFFIVSVFFRPIMHMLFMMIEIDPYCFGI